MLTHSAANVATDTDDGPRAAARSRRAAALLDLIRHPRTSSDECAAAAIAYTKLTGTVVPVTEYGWLFDAQGQVRPEVVATVNAAVMA